MPTGSYTWPTGTASSGRRAWASAATAGAADVFDFLTGDLEQVRGNLNIDAGAGRHRVLVSDEADATGDGTLASPVVITDVIGPATGQQYDNLVAAEIQVKRLAFGDITYGAAPGTAPADIAASQRAQTTRPLRSTARPSSTSAMGTDSLHTSQNWIFIRWFLALRFRRSVSRRSVSLVARESKRYRDSGIRGAPRQRPGPSRPAE